MKPASIPLTTVCATLAVLVSLAPRARGQHTVYDHDGFYYGEFPAAVGDVDGDGLGDWAHYLRPPSGPGPHSVRVHSGADGSLLSEKQGPWGTTSIAGFGRSIVRAGDLNGDGEQDLVAGAPFAPYPGADSGEVDAFSALTGADLWTSRGPDGSEFGSALDNLGDVDGDGIDDLLVGAPLTRFGGKALGAAFVLSGVDGKIIRTLAGTQIGARFGQTVASLGDVDFDGIADILVGAPFEGVALAGAAHAYSSATGTLLFDFPGVLPDDLVGAAVAGAGDVDGDGSGDALIGAPGTGTLPAKTPGKAWLVSGATGQVLQAYTPGASWERMGASLDGGCDLDGDGVPDVLIGSPGGLNAQGVEISPGRARAYSGATGALLVDVSGESDDDGFGYVAFLGDVTRDGTVDFLVGAPRDDNGGPDLGRVSVRAGPGSGAQSYCAGGTNSVGLEARIAWSGQLSISTNAFALGVGQCPADKAGVFFAGRGHQQVPFGSGFLCVDPAGAALIRLTPPVKTGALGTAALLVDLATGPAAAITPGVPWYFQFRYRDPQGPGPVGWNLSDGLAVTFAP